MDVIFAVNTDVTTALAAQNADLNLRISSLASANVATSNEALSLIGTTPPSAHASFASRFDARYNSVSTSTSGLVTTWTAGFSASGSVDASGFFGPFTMFPGYDYYRGSAGSVLTTPTSWYANINKTTTGTTLTGDVVTDIFKFNGDSSGAGKLDYSHNVHDLANTVRTDWSGIFDIPTSEFQFRFSKKDSILDFSVGAEGTPAALMMANGNLDIMPGTGSNFHFDFNKTMNSPIFYNGSIEQLVGTSDGGDIKIALEAHRNIYGTYGTAGASYLNGGNSIAIIAAHNNPDSGHSYSGVTTYSLDSLIPFMKINGSTGIDWDYMTGIRSSRIHESLSLSYERDTQYWKVLTNAGVKQMGFGMPWMQDTNFPNFGKDTIYSGVWVIITPR